MVVETTTTTCYLGDMPKITTGTMVVACAYLLAALLVATGDAISAGNADNLIPTLMSVQHWTPFFWGNAARVGSLVPALAAPIHGPVANWITQCTITAMAGLACFALVPRYVIGGESWKTTGPLGALLWLLAVDRHVLAGWLIPGQPYAVGLTLGLAALLAWDAGDPTRTTGGILVGSARAWHWRTAGVVLLVLAFWVHSGLGLLLFPLWIARRSLEWLLERPVGVGLRFVGPGLILALQAAWTVYYAATDTEPRYLGIVAFHAIPGALGAAISNTFIEAGPGLVVVGMLLALVMLQVPAEIFAAPKPLVAPVALGLASLVSAVPVAMNAWVDANQHSARYYMGAMVLGACATAALVPALGVRWRFGLAVAMPLAAILRFGDINGVRAQLMTMAPFAAQADQTRCTGLTGNDYWAIWPEVMGVLELRHQRGDPLPVYGLVARGEATLDLARAVPADQARVCRLGDTHKR